MKVINLRKYQPKKKIYHVNVAIPITLNNKVRIIQHKSIIKIFIGFCSLHIGLSESDEIEIREKINNA